ncbi:hypothetical protein OSC52_15250 [Clostridium pasteurianum]|uniref:hypothetical protein n=1 Tax=Clostridium pasteurianum TaxID=1501 RepID=UPI0022609BCD|nr:hypothetical protein [Clostridium pasteurianum]UZW13193.1 hypothetical protein OSC52_15250 [Clostridium pasteurianum]
MNIGNIQEYKIEIGEKEYTFRLDFKALIKFNERYKNYKKVPLLDANKKPVLDKNTGEVLSIEVGAIDIFNNCINGINQYDGIIKILSCSCIEKDFTEDELLESLSFDLPTMKLLDLIVDSMIQGSIKLEKSTEKNEGAEKN